MSSIGLLAMLAPVAEQQWGYLTTAQAAALGISRDRLAKLTRAGALENAGHGVHRMVGAPTSSHEDIHVHYLALRERSRRAGVPDLVVGGRTAARLHDMGDYWPGVVEFITRAPFRSTRAGVTLTQSALSEHEVITVHGLPVLSGEATIRELLRAGGDRSLVATALMDGLQQGKVDLPKLSHLLDELTPTAEGSSGLALTDMLVRAMPMSRSLQEWYLLRPAK